MNHMYAEAGVKRQDTLATIALRVLIYVGILLGVVIALLGSYFSIIGVAIVGILFYLFPRLNVEYEYVFVDGQLDFDKIMGKAKRKTMLRIDMEQIDLVAPLNSHALDNYNHIQLENKDFSSRDKNSKPYVVILNNNNKKMRILFEPNEKMLNVMKQKSPRKVVTY